jgi:hypothetical protein
VEIFGCARNGTLVERDAICEQQLAGENIKSKSLLLCNYCMIDRYTKSDRGPHCGEIFGTALGGASIAIGFSSL